MTIHVLLPAYEEAANLPALLTALAAVLRQLDAPAQVLLIDDGSGDDTAAVAARFASVLPLTVVRHPRNLGLGRTLADGLTRTLASAADEDVVITMDADDTHPPALIPSLLTGLAGGAEVVVASRYVAGARVHGVPLRRRLLSRAAAALVQRGMPRCGARDVTCGFRAYRAAVLRRAVDRYGVLVEADGFACMLDLLLKMGGVGARVVEVPIELRYDRKRGASKLRVLRTVAETMRVLRRHRSAPPRPAAST